MQTLPSVDYLMYCKVLTETKILTALFESPADPKMESKEDQWMGVTVQSQGPGGNVVVSLQV